MQLAQSFEVAAPIDRVWRALIDIEHVAPCLPGAAITGRSEDGSYAGSFTVKIGPTKASYTGKLEMLEIDAEARRAMMHANGTDQRGQGGATATIVSKLTESAAGGTHVEVQTDYRITGRLARFGRGGMIEDISERLLRQFAERLAASLTPDEIHAAPAAVGPAAAQSAEPAAAESFEPTPEAHIEPTADARGGAESAEAGAGTEPSGSEPSPNGAAAAAAAARAWSPPPQIESHRAEFTDEAPDMGKLVTEALLARASRSVVPFVAGVVVGIVAVSVLRGRRRRGA